MTEARFSYGSGGGAKGAIATLLVLGTGGWLAWLASTNDRGLVIEDMIELSPGGATVLYWVGAGFTFSVALLIGYLALGDIFVGRRENIDLTSESIIVPVSGWSAKESTVRYDDISDISVRSVFGHRLLTITHSEGRVVIGSDSLPDEDSFDMIHGMLSERIWSSTSKDCQPAHATGAAVNGNGSEGERT